MPGFDKSGPQGKGSCTGRRRGNCSSKNSENSNNVESGEFPGRGNRNQKQGRRCRKNG